MANSFEAELSESMKHLGWFVAKLAVPTARNARFLRNPPFDFIALSDGKSFGFEAKSTRVHGSLPLDRLEVHQREGLEWLNSQGGNAYILINFRRRRKNRKLVSDNVAYAISIDNWNRVVNDLTGSRKSIPKDWFSSDKRFITIPRQHVNKKLIWDLRVLK